MPALEEYQKAIEKRISELTLPAEPKNLYEPIYYFLSLGGKRMRPVLVLMSHELFGGNYTKVISPALAMELFHNFSLVHDDIMDKAALRRGKATVHEKWNTNTAILSGDAILIEAYKLLAEVESKYLSVVLTLFNRTAIEVCEGQVMDMDFETRSDVTIDEYIKMIRLKTAVLLGGCLETGAILAGADKENAKHIYDFGINLGIAFQLHDDILDVYADPDKFGKAVGGDIAANKKTFLFLKTLELCSQKDKSEIKELLKLKGKSKIERMITLYNKNNIKAETEKVMGEFFNNALVSLGKINADEEKKMPLRIMAEELMRREK